MKKIITTIVVLSLFVALFIFSNNQSNTTVEKVIIPIQKQETLKELVAKYANEYKVSKSLISELITLENKKDWDTTLQSGCHYLEDNIKWGVKKGDRELSFGLAMIHLPSHPNITYNNAIDPNFSINYMASEISKGKGKQWSCYNKAIINIKNNTTGGKCI